MKNQVNWNRQVGKETVVELFIKFAGLNEEDSTIMRDRANKVKQVATAQNINRSERYVKERIYKYLMPKYDEIQELYPHLFNKRELYDAENVDYTNFNGNLVVEAMGNKFTIDLANKTYNSLEEIRKLVRKEISEKLNIPFNELDKIHFCLLMGWDINIHKKLK